jgi:small subunit ribosomal protein S16
MAIKIRLRRAGKPGRAFYHIVVADGRFPRDGRFIEKLGYYDPIPNPAIAEFKTDRAIYWLGKGAKPSSTVLQLFKKKGVMAAMKKGGAVAAAPEPAKVEG